MTPEQFSALISELRGIRLGIYWAAGLLVLTVALAAVRVSFTLLRRLEREQDQEFEHEAKSLYEKDELEELISRCRDVLKERPNHLYARWYLSRALYMREEWSAARDELLALRSKTPDWAGTIDPLLREIRSKSGLPAEPSSSKGQE